MPFNVFFDAFALGLSVAAPIGPVNIEIIRRGLTRGAPHAFALGCGAVSADCAYFAASLVAAGFAKAVLDSAVGNFVAFGAGGSLLLWIAWMCLRSKPPEALNAGDDTKPTVSRAELARTYAFGLAMTLTNPMTIAFWLGIAAAPVTAGAAWLRWVGVGCGALSWVIFLTTLLAFARPWVGPKLFLWVNRVSGAFLVYSGLRMWLRALKPFIG